MLIRILLIEDDQADAFLIKEMLAETMPLTKGETVQSDIHHVERLAEGLVLAANREFDLILSDLGLPDSQGLATVRQLAAAARGIPIVVLSGLADPESGWAMVNAGAQDYLVKGEVNGEMLVRSMRYAIERKRIENEKVLLIAELRQALAQVKLLSGFLPICCSCKKIRDDVGYWQQIESYISAHSEVEFSHGICPECARKLYPELYED